MSEYQYYEFRTIDHPLDRKQMDELRALSTRAEITPTSFTNTYHWGDFKGDPAALMDRHFDAFVYVANWGTHWLMFRIPAGFLEVDMVRRYCVGNAVSVTDRQKHVVIGFSSQDDEGDQWVEGEHWMPSLVSIRDELMRGDLRALYLGWLASLSERDWIDEEVDEDEIEPLVPPGLGTLSAPLRALTDFLRVDDDLLEVAAAGSVGEFAATPSPEEMVQWVKSLPAAEKDDYLVRFLARESDVVLRAELAKRYREATSPQGPGQGCASGRRTVAELLTARDSLAEERSRGEAEKMAKERACREREQAEARAKYLDELCRQEPATWRQVEQLIATKRPKDYDRAVDLLVDLRDLAERSGRTEEAAKRTRTLRDRHANKPSLLKRFEEKKLGR